MTDDEKAIRKLVDDWIEATQAGEKETVLDLVADDVLFMTPGQPPFGKKEFAGEPGNDDMPKMTGTAKILEMEVFGDRAWIRNQIDIEITQPNGAPLKLSGLTLTLLRKESDGKWRLFRDANFVAPVS